MPHQLLSPAARRAAPSILGNRTRFLAACGCQAVDRPPVWLMRQAGRCLPEYRLLREKYSFVQMVRTPELAARITLQPIERFGFDAAILFSDILVVPEALGQGFAFRESGGIEMAFPVRSSSDVLRLDPSRLSEKLSYVTDAMTLVARQLAGRAALLGFAGSPWTLANYMIEGSSVREWTRARVLMHEDPALFGRLMEKITAGVIAALKLQIAAGADAVQIFDSSGGHLSPSDFERGSARWMRQVIEALQRDIPVIVYSRGAQGWSSLLNTGASVIGLDWTADIARVASILPRRVAVQGNLDPIFLNTRPKVVTAETLRILRAMRGRAGYIFNLGHGVPPTARLECIEALVDTVKTFV